MSYNIVSAAYANADNTAVVIQTQDFGAVVISEKDRPELWAAFQKWVYDGGQAAEYVAPAVAKPLTVESLASALKEKGVLTDGDLEAAKK